MKTAIVGMPKTGTTALFEALKRGAPSGTRFFFEPKTSEECSYIEALSDDVLAKFMLTKLNAMDVDFLSFDKVVAIVRDPRDFIVSSLIYKFDSREILNDRERFKRLRDMFVAKEKAPNEISIKHLYDEASPSGVYNWELVEQLLQTMIDFVDQYDFLHMLKYEDFVDNRLEETSKYLGFEISNSVSLSGWTEKISRKGTAGDWRNWFTEQDRQLMPFLQDFMVRFAYDLDYALSEHPVIEAEHCSEYIDRLEAKSKVDPVRGKVEINDEYIHNLESAVEDGKHVAMTKLALLLMEGKHIDQNKLRASELLEVAHAMGNVTAKRELGRIRLDQGETAAAFQLFEQAVDAGDRESCFDLGVLLLGKAKQSGDYSQPLGVFEQGAERGSKSCMRRLARIYENGSVVERDEHRGQYWAKMADMEI